MHVNETIEQNEIEKKKWQKKILWVGKKSFEKFVHDIYFKEEAS